MKNISTLADYDLMSRLALSRKGRKSAEYIDVPLACVSDIPVTSRE